MEYRPERDVFDRVGIETGILIPTTFDKNKERFYANLAKIANNIADEVDGIDSKDFQLVFDTNIQNLLYKNKTGLLLGYIVSNTDLSLKDILIILPKLEDQSLELLDIIRYKRFWDKKRKP